MTGAVKPWPAAGGRFLRPVVLAVFGLILLAVGAGLIALAAATGTLLFSTSRPAPPSTTPVIRLVIPGSSQETQTGDSSAPIEQDTVIVMPSPAELDDLVNARLAVEPAAPILPNDQPAANSRDGQPPATGGASTEPLTYKQLFQAVGAESGLDWRLLAAVAYRESRLDPHAVGKDNDMGLMQILPSTWNEWAPTVEADDPFDPYDNAKVAAAYLRYLEDYLSQLGHDELYWVLVAYNWGPDNVGKLLARGGEWYDVPARQRHYAADILEAAFGS